jgi:cytochrome c peroxidase
MLPVLVFLSAISVSFAQSDLEYYIQRWRYKALDVPAKKTALYNLGVKLFSDKNLSGKNNISCQGCHSTEGFSADALPLGLGEGAEGLGARRTQKSGVLLSRHTQSLYNVGLAGFNDMFWDGRVAKDLFGGWRSPEPKFNGANPALKEIAETFTSALALQAVFPLVSPDEMLGKESKLTRMQAWDQVMSKIQTGPDAAVYKKLFKDAYPLVKDINIAHVGNAMAEFVRHKFLAVNTPWDMYLRGKKEMLTARMKRGAVLFHSRANCIFCHAGNQFTNFSFENVGTPQLNADDKGLFALTKKPADMYAFRVAPLRNVGVTAPYMHDGVFKTLHEVVDHYENPVASLRSFRWTSRYPNYRDPVNLDTSSANNDNREKTMSQMLARKLTLTADEKDDLVCFLAVALTDMSLQKELKKNGVVNEISDCSPGAR